jgi:hypothetical protein
MKRTEWTWDMHAEAFLRTKFLPRARGQAFLVEQFRKAAEKAGVPAPADPHSWGGFFKRMRRDGLVRTAGYGLDSFGSPKSFWRAV